jgi:hypothetical protein
MNNTKYFRLVSTVSSLITYIKVDEWNGDKIIYYPCCTLYNGTIVYNILCKDNIIKKVFDRKYLSINCVTIETEITEEEWEKMLAEL